ncbi:MAG: hypothetical protein ABIF85_01835 [Nanoarchaeota archaeon]|nr:hypothetical protein [Nanoarchaeota archaeon]MBU4299638.1 hypothetical protein [Nanoarchaeota archaeon]MBU4452628.1 hypothetical protein [Nanoarchaeota archaeon]
MNIKSLLVLILGIFLFFWSLTNFGGGEFAEEYIPYVFGGIVLAAVIFLLRRR